MGKCKEKKLMIFLVEIKNDDLIFVSCELKKKNCGLRGGDSPILKIKWECSLNLSCLKFTPVAEIVLISEIYTR